MAEGDVTVEVEVETPPEPEHINPPEPEIIHVPIPTNNGNEAYQTEHNERHDGLENRLKEIEGKLDFHDDMHRHHEEGLGQVHERITRMVEENESKAEEEPDKTIEPIVEGEPTIIPPDIPRTEVTDKPKHWLRKIGF